jgi:hypothetical protein
MNIESTIPVPVTYRVKAVKQPYGGYIKPKLFDETQLDGGGIIDLNPSEHTSPSLVGIGVDYLTRFMTGSAAAEAFSISRRGARIVGKADIFETLLNEVHGLDDKSIRSALRISGFDSAYRAGVVAYTPVETINPDAATIANVRVMVGRALRFFDQYGPKLMDDLTFEGGYNGKYVNAGDGDFMTADTLWDFKVSKQRLNSKQTLQLLMYWRMGLHSVHPEYSAVKYLGIYNPRTNIVRRISTAQIDDQTIQEVERDVIGY